ncbi:hypothetical protein chiPu_0009491 [Chiloscyllium punctatum]|uniref:Uncharacterized protein n=1 Tax=Chiloscyllium punctatum TaxID=137246 RepID=A0A401SKW6_CHIPU|nr:hypothetical protein [Chiloscyllium punctatum]
MLKSKSEEEEVQRNIDDDYPPSPWTGRGSITASPQVKPQFVFASATCRRHFEPRHWLRLKPERPPHTSQPGGGVGKIDTPFGESEKGVVGRGLVLLCG